MVSFLSFVTLALVGMAVASPLKRAPSPVLSLSADVDSIEENSLVSSVENSVSSRELGTESDSEIRARVACSDSNQSKFIFASYSEAKTLARIAADYIRTHGAHDSLFKDYFGATNSFSTQLGVFTDAANQNSVTLSCTDPFLRCANDVTAYTVRSTGNIYYCPAFYNQVATSRLCSGRTVGSRSIRGGTTLHEVTRVVSGTTELRVGCSDSRKLASDHPDLASQNADNYNCFATQVYANTQCSG